MPKKHAFVVALFLAVALVLGAFGALRTAQLSSSARSASAATVTQRERRLDQAERQLQAALRRRPPALPALRSGAVAQAGGQRVEYVRPAPIVITRPSAAREHESEHELEAAERHGGESDD